MSDPAYMVFFQNAFSDGTINTHKTPEALLDALIVHKDCPPKKKFTGTTAFLVTANQALNDMAPVEVLAGKRFQVAEDDPVQVGYGSKGAVIIPFSETDQRAQARLLNYKVEERVIRVLYAARDYYDVLGD